MSSTSDPSSLFKGGHDIPRFYCLGPGEHDQNTLLASATLGSECVTYEPPIFHIPVISLSAGFTFPSFFPVALPNDPGLMGTP